MDSKDPKQVAIVTGSNTGIGRETALSLAKDGMKVFMSCRSADRGHAAASYIREINNAGIYSKTPWYTAEGVGGNTQVNHLGHYLLTRLLEDSLVAGAPSRVVFAPTWDGAIPVYHAATTPLKTDQDKTPFRLFAREDLRGAGYAIYVTTPNSTPMVWLMGLPTATLDWPVWYLSKGAFFSKVVLVPTNPQAYDEDLASKLWSLSADAARLSE